MNYFVALAKDASCIYQCENINLNLVEMIELKNHPWFVAVQFHPELKSRIVNVHPLFRDFIAAAICEKDSKQNIQGLHMEQIP